MKVLGQELQSWRNQILALIFNILSWARGGLRLSNSGLDRKRIAAARSCVQITGPGGFEQFRDVPLTVDRSEDGRLLRVPVGYNLGPELKAPLVEIPVGRPYEELFPEDAVIVYISAFSVNYADVCIRWGLYESAMRYVGFPIVPGFDFSGYVHWAGKASGFSRGDCVFGFSLFGAYSDVVLVPGSQIVKVPERFGPTPRADMPNIMSKIAGVPAVAATALHALAQCRAFPERLLSSNKAALIHSAAGGVGSMLIQMCRLRGLGPIVAVIGSSHKRDYCLALGADFVIDKSKENLWKRAEEICPQGFAAVFDANGLETLQGSYEHLSTCGTLVSYGFHSNIPKASAFISPFHWIKVILGMFSMPKFDAMDMVVSSKTVCGFNLSFFADEKEAIALYMGQIHAWLESGELRPLEVREYEMAEVDRAHEHIQSGLSVGKIVVKTAADK